MGQVVLRRIAEPQHVCLMRLWTPPLSGEQRGMRGFSLPELLVVIGIMALLMAILLQPLRAAHRHAVTTKCATQLRQLGQALEGARNDYRFYPIWDDGAQPIRFTWIDLLIQRHQLLDRRVGYCPEDQRPGWINSARGDLWDVFYPGKRSEYGIDYSYGIAVPLSAGGWAWQPGFAQPYDDDLPRRLENYERFPGQRVLAADSNWSTIYNLSGGVVQNTSWNDPTEYDNMVDWRHPKNSANVLYQDMHVARVTYTLAAAEPVNTASSFVWHPGESLYINPDDTHGNNAYPNVPPVNIRTGETGAGFPAEMVPGYYTHNRLWTVSK
jgi:prepilin-type N-terminal cleavage/methylation domain-containing protein